MAGETYNLAILLSLKDTASGGLMSFSANSHRAVSQIKTDLDALEKTGREQTSAISKEIGKKVSTVEKLGGQLTKINSLKSGGLQNATKQSSVILKQINQESLSLQNLSKVYEKAENAKGAKAADEAAKGLLAQSKGIEAIGAKLKTLDKLRQQGTDSAKQQAKSLEAELQKEIETLDDLASKLREIKGIKIDNLDVNIKANSLKDQISAIGAYEDRYDQLKRKMARDASLGGVGVAGLYTLNKGVGYAASKEDTVLNLRQAYAENASASSKSSAMQEADIRRIMALATELGTKLSGSVSDYAMLFTAMNKSGIDADVTLGGAGKAAAYLANVTGALKNGTAPQQAEDLGSFGKMFDLKGDDYMKVVQLFSGLEDRFNISSGSLVEASKYFFSTAKTGMGLKGIDGAETTAQLFAFLKRYAGREGSEAGTSLDALLNQFIRHDDARKALKKDTGVDLQLFDQKGNFNGVENMFKEFEKLQKLSPEKRMKSLNAIFGEQGSRIVSAMVDQGVKGWRSIATEAAKSVSVNDKINQQMETYNAKMEALTGSLENLTADAFTPLLDDAKGLVDFLGRAVNVAQEFSASHQDLMGIIGTMALYGSTALVAYSAIKTLTTGVRLFKMAGAISRGDGLINFLTQTTASANSTATALAGATTKAGGLKNTLSGFANSSALKVGVQVVGIAAAELAITSFVQMVQENNARLEQMAVDARGFRQGYDEMMGSGLSWNKPGDYKGQKGMFDAQADSFLKTITEGTVLKGALNPEQRTTWEYISLPNPYLNVDTNSGKSESFSPEMAAKYWASQPRLTLPLQDPNQLARVIDKIQSGGGDLNLNQGAISLLIQALEKVTSPDKMKTAFEVLNKERYGEKPNIAQQPQSFTQSIANLYKPNSTLFNSFGNQPPKNFFQRETQANPLIKSPLQGAQALNFTPTVQGLFDLNKPLSATTTGLTNLYQPVINLVPPFTNIQLPLTALVQPLNNTQQSISELPQTVDKTKESFNGIILPINQTKTSLFNLINSINGINGSLDSVSDKLSNWQPPAPQGYSLALNTPSQTQNTNPLLPNLNLKGGHAVGGTVRSKGVAYIHANEDIVPASVTAKYREPVGLNALNKLNSFVENNSSSWNVRSNINKPSNASRLLINNFQPLSKATGGTVQSKGLIYIHANKDFAKSDTQNINQTNNSSVRSMSQMRESGINNIERIDRSAARNAENYSGRSGANSPSVVVNYNAPITINGANKSDQEIKAEFQQQLAMHSRDLEHRLTKVLQNRRERA